MSQLPPASRPLHVPAAPPATSEQQEECEAAGPSPAPLTSLPHQPRAGRQAFFRWVGNQVRRSRAVTSTAATPAGLATAHEHAEIKERRRRGLALLDRSVYLVEQADHCNGNQAEKSALLQELTKHLADMRALTAALDNHRAADLELGSAAASATAALPFMLQGREPASQDELITGRCLEMMNALPALCIALSRPQSKASSLSAYYFQIDERFPLGAELENMLTHAALAQTVYDEDVGTNLSSAAREVPHAMPLAWRSMSVPDSLLTAFRSICPNLRQLDDGRFCDHDSGLVMQVFENHEEKKVVLAFGGTTAGETKGPLFTRLLSNPWITATQWRANVAAATGLIVFGGPVPDCYDRAARLGGALMQHLQRHPADAEWTVSLTGHSKGGAEAEYAALLNGVPAICFGTPELGKAVLDTVSQAQLLAGARNIRHYFVKGDVAPLISTALAHLLPERLAHVGTGFWMEPTPEVGNLPLSRNLWCHDLFFQSALHEAEKHRPALE